MKFKLPPSYYREDGTIRDYKKIIDETLGVAVGLETETHYLPPHKVKVEWFQYDGTPVDESYDGHVRSHLFQVTAEGIDTTLVKNVEFPPLDYASNEDYLVKIETFILED